MFFCEHALSLEISTSPGGYQNRTQKNCHLDGCLCLSRDFKCNWYNQFHTSIAIPMRSIISVLRLLLGEWRHNFQENQNRKINTALPFFAQVQNSSPTEVWPPGCKLCFTQGHRWIWRELGLGVIHKWRQQNVGEFYILHSSSVFLTKITQSPFLFLLRQNLRDNHTPARGIMGLM